MANIKVAVRVRPISEREIHLTGSEIVVHTEPKAISLTNLKVSSSKAGDSRERTRRYAFDYCFDSSDPTAENYASQSRIYGTLGESILDALFRGYNSCLVAYGQSASGKTYTMMGSKDDPGLTPRVCEGVFLRLANEEQKNQNFDISVSYLEVYNERVRDLLRPTSSSIGLRVREHPRLGPYVQGLTHHAVPTLGSLISRVEEGTRARKTASTLQNPTSSRSHALLTLSLLPNASNHGTSLTIPTTATITVPRRNDFPRGSKLHLVDLAGSESAAACGGINRLKEGANINKSLVALGNVISALAERGATGSGPGRRFIPYRDSALTWLLKDALGGNATTVMLATISPASGSYNETSHTLRFAQRAQSVVNRPVINEDPVSRIIKELRDEVARLTSLLLEKNINPGIDCKSICSCQHNQEQKIKNQEPEAPYERGPSLLVVNSKDRIVEKEEEEEEKEEYEVPKEVNHSRFSERRHSSSERSVSEKELPRPVRRFGSFEAVPETKNSLDIFETELYKQAEVSKITNNEVEEPTFVDIPTLVAVLIKPDSNNKTDSQQIEKIYSDNHPEDLAEVDFQKSDKQQTSYGNKEFPSFPVNETSVGCTSSLENFESSQSTLKTEKSSVNLESTDKKYPEIETCIPESITQTDSSRPREKARLRKQDSIDGDLASKRSTNLQSLKKFGSIESLTRRKEITCSIQRSNTNLEKRNVALDKTKKLNNIKEVDDQKLNKLGNAWRNLSSWGAKDFQRKGSNDSDKSSKDSLGNNKPKSQPRKQSIEGLKRKTSKDSSSSSSKDELLSGTGQSRERSSRKGSLDQEQIPVRVHTPIQRARRAEIVAAVTERLYSSKKLFEDNNTTTTGTTASTPASEVRSPESTDVKLASATRMRLQEISRKMLAKRRRICVDTQTDNEQTVRVRDAASITEEPKIIRKDVSILTDRHEDYEILPTVDYPVLRVKEISTTTDSNQEQHVVRCKDVGNVTDDYYEDYAGIGSPRNDSGIMSDDAQNYAESNMSSAGASDLCQIVGRRSVELAENSTNTRMPVGPPNAGSQTRKDDLLESHCSHREAKCCNTTTKCHTNNSIHKHDHVKTHCHSEKNVISISLPDMLSITIESSNGLESKIKVFDGNESNDERNLVGFKDNQVQTDPKNALEIGTSTDDIFEHIYFNDFALTTKPIIGQTDNKTFRIENIFREPRGIIRTTPRIEVATDSAKNIQNKNELMITNSIGNSFLPERRENTMGLEGGRNYGSKMYLGTPTRRRSSDAFLKNTWPTRWRTCSPNSRWQTSHSNYLTNDGNYGSLPTNFEPYSECGSDYRKPHMDEELGLNVSGFTRKVLKVDELGSGNDLLKRKKSTDYVVMNAVPFQKSNFAPFELRSPSIISMMDKKSGFEQDTNFSDDSLEPKAEDNPMNNLHEDSQPKLESQQVINKTSAIKGTEKLCPPDVVAHTKMDLTDSLIPGDNSIINQDFEHSQQIQFPKIKPDAIKTPSFVTPINDFKSLILGDPFYNQTQEDFDFTEFSNQSSTSTLKFDENSYRNVDAIEDKVNAGRSEALRPIIKKDFGHVENLEDDEDCQSDCRSKNLECQSSCRKKVHFAVPEVSELISSDSEHIGNLTSDEESTIQDPRSILEEYLDEAVVFMRNMNSMNEYMSATCTNDKYLMKRRYRGRGKPKSSNYIEYEGRKISLDDDTDQYLKSDDEDLNFNVETYDECLRSMDRLEECLAKVKQHDEIIRSNYGTNINVSAGAKHDLAKFSTDPRDKINCLKDKAKPSDRIKTDKRTIEAPNFSDRQNNNRNLKNYKNMTSDQSTTFSADDDEEDEKYFDNLKKIRSRKLPRISDVRKKSPTTYSQLKSRYGSRVTEVYSMKKDNIMDLSGKLETLQQNGSATMTDEDSLQPPSDCYLVLPKTGRIGGVPSEEIKSSTSGLRFSLSKYDSSNESSSSNEALATFMESIDNLPRSRDKFKYPGSPRAKFLQLLSERRRIVENTRSTGAS